VQTALALLLAGALGNLVDRLKYRYVIDFIDVRFWPVFNIADIVINVGVGMLIVEMFWESHDEIKENESEN
jgi:signal peptidase II